MGGFILWNIAPYVALAIIAYFQRYSRPRSWIALVGSATSAAFGNYAIFDAMYVHTDAQGGLIFIFAPLYQVVIVLLTALTILITWAIGSTRRRTSTL